jgi:hypothetical protein
VEAVGSANDPLNSAPSRLVFRPPVRRGLIVAAMATLLALAPGVADGRDGPSAAPGLDTSASGMPAAGLRAGGHVPSAGGAANTTGAPATASLSGHTLDQTVQAVAGSLTQGGHQTGLFPWQAYSTLQPDALRLWQLETGDLPDVSSLFLTANIANPSSPGVDGASLTGGFLPPTSATSDQHPGASLASILPVISITIGPHGASAAIGGALDGAGFGPLGGTVDVTLQSPDTNPLVEPGLGSLDGLGTDVAIDLTGLFTTQFDGSQFATANCNMAAGAMLYEIQTGLNVTGGQMRAWSGATTRGTSLEDLSHAFKTQGQPLSIHRYMSWNHFQHAVASGRSAVVQGWYGFLPHHFDLQPSFVAGHSIFVLGYSPHAFGERGGFYVMDPLGHAGYSGQWWPSDVLRTYGWSGKPGHAGQGSPLSYLGFVALQANRSAKTLTGPAGRPAFQDYWQTTKEALEAALRVIVMTGHGANLPAIRGVVLLIHDPRLNLTAASAQQLRALGWPVAGKARILRKFSAHHPVLELAPGKSSSVLAAADGRVVFESLRTGSATQTIWVQHGLDLFTAYEGLGHVNVKAGEWVSKGDLLGSVSGSTGRLLFSVSVGAFPSSATGHADPARFLPLN